MSDGEGTAGEMSDGSEPKKKKPGLKMRIGGGTNLSPSSSRAGSPSSGSRAGSPAAIAQAQQCMLGNYFLYFTCHTAHIFFLLFYIVRYTPLANAASLIPAPDSTSTASGAGNPKPVTAEEIIAALPPNGISIGNILKLFPGRIVDKKHRERFIRMVKENSSYNPEDKLLRPKT